MRQGRRFLAKSFILLHKINSLEWEQPLFSFQFLSLVGKFLTINVFRTHLFINARRYVYVKVHVNQQACLDFQGAKLRGGLAITLMKTVDLMDILAFN